MFSQIFSILIITVSLLNHNQVFSAPALFWTNLNSPPASVPLSTISSLDLISNYICKLPSGQIQLRLFALDELTNEDIQRGTQSKHSILLDAKNENSQFRYFPNVANDINKTLSLLPQSNNMQCSNIQFQLTSSNTYKTLNDALNSMQASIDSIGENSNINILMALVSGPVVQQQNSIRRRRELEVDENEVIISDDSSCMFYAEELYWGDINDKDQSAGNYTLDLIKSSCVPDTVVTQGGNITSVVLELYWNNGTSEGDTVKMSIIANITGRYWYLEKAIVNDAEYRYFAYGMHSKMDTPPAYSYVCTTATFVKYNSTPKFGKYDFEDKFYLTNLQFQPFYANGSYFGPPNYCTSFFTSGIWMGITTSLLCLGILLFGVHRLMSIKSNDRFDDPKGKPLIIKAQE